MNKTRDIAEENPPVDELPHKDDVPPYNGDRKAEWAIDDDGNVYKVVCADRYPETCFIPLEKTRDYVLPRRERVGDQCRLCDEEIGSFAIIVIGPDGQSHHIGCWASEGQ